MCGADQNRRTSFTALPSVFLKFIIRPFIGTGIGRFRLINDCYRWVARSFIIPQEKNIITINGYKMHVNLDRKEGLDGIGQELLFNGTYERYSTALFQQFIKPGMTVVAIGANSGYFVLLFSSLAGQHGRVYAFEPAPQNFTILTGNIELNGFNNITALQKAVADKSGNSLLYIDSSDPAGHSLYNKAVSQVSGNAVESCAVEVVSLDDYFAGSDTNIDVIQMDIQGAEILATRGMANLLLKNNDINFVTEFWPYGLDKCGFSAQQYWDQLKGLHFNYIYLIDERRQKLRLVSFAEVISICQSNAISPPTAVNLLCLRSPLAGNI